MTGSARTRPSETANSGARRERGVAKVRRPGSRRPQNGALHGSNDQSGHPYRLRGHRYLFNLALFRLQIGRCLPRRILWSTRGPVRLCAKRLDRSKIVEENPLMFADRAIVWKHSKSGKNETALRDCSGQNGGSSCPESGHVLRDRRNYHCRRRRRLRGSALVRYARHEGGLRSQHPPAYGTAARLRNSQFSNRS
jgi:hypothetical protein